MKRTYLIFVVQGYNAIDSLGNLEDVCTLELVAETYKDAEKKAKKLIKKKHYRCSGVIEKN